MPSRNIKIYRYKRGEEFSCDVSVIEDEHTVFSNIVTPANCEPEVESRLLDDAEKEALKLHNEGLAQKWLNSKS